jgi:hypothetical protein
MSPSTSGQDSDAPAQTNLGLLLQQALAAQQTAEAAEAEKPAEEPEAPARETNACADCWNALTFKDAEGRQMARCAKDLWVKPFVTYEELNNHKVRRWFITCPEYDDSE